MRVLVDTSAVYALLDEDDPKHRDSVNVLAELRGRAELVTHNYVVVEVIALVRRRLGPEMEIRLIDSLLPLIDTIWVDEALHRTALTAYRAAGRQASVVDHVSFALMRAEGVTYAWAYDHDFEREGLRLPPLGTARTPRRLSETKAAFESTSNLVSVAEIAARSGRSTNTVQSWRRRHRDFPTPAATLAAAPVWAWPEIERWIARRPSVLASRS